MAGWPPWHRRTASKSGATLYGNQTVVCVCSMPHPVVVPVPAPRAVHIDPQAQCQAGEWGTEDGQVESMNGSELQRLIWVEGPRVGSLLLSLSLHLSPQYSGFSGTERVSHI